MRASAISGQVRPAGLPPNQGGLSSRLWADSEVEAFRSLYSPFVQALADGSLDRRSFQSYVAQDATFLHGFARAYALALAKCDSTSASVGAAGGGVAHRLASLLQGVHEELKLHQSYAEQWGVSLEDGHHPPLPATTHYIDFLMAVADDPSTSVTEVLAAMLPCSRLYAFLGCQLARAAAAAAEARGPAAITPCNDYAGWVATYSSPDYLALPDVKEALLETLCAGDDPDTYGVLRGLYRRAMQLESAFFAAQPFAPPARRIRMLIVDFDDTCTVGDTISNLLAGATEAVVQACSEGTGRDALRQELQAKRERMSANYVTQQRALMKELLPEDEVPSPASFDPVLLTSLLERLSDFDVAMNAVVVQSGIMAGLSESDLCVAASRVQLRPGCSDALAAVLAAGVPLSVLSVNWSAAYVAAALRPLPAFVRSHTEQGAAAGLHGDGGGISITANRLATGADGRTSGDIVTAVQCARDKGAMFAALTAQPSSTPREQAGNMEGATVYVGDSSSDLLPLVQADYGIVMGADKSLRRFARRCGLRLLPLCAAPLGAAAPTGVIYEANGWAEIRAFLLPLEQPPAEAAAAAAVGQPGVASPSRTSGHASTSGRGTSDNTGARRRTPVVLTIAGSDSGGGAGIQADLKTFMACGVFGTSAVAALTAQNTHGVLGVLAVAPDFLVHQIDSVLSDMGAEVVKTGMLPSADAVIAVAGALRRWDVRQLVVDPVMVSTSGHALAGQEVVSALLSHLLPLATMITPNMGEASKLLGGRAVLTVADMEAAARELHHLVTCTRRAGAEADASSPPRDLCVLVKGGHLAPGSPVPRRPLHAAAVAASSAGQLPQEGEEAEDVVVDVLFDGVEVHYLHAPRVITGNTHGTGCTLASAIAAELAQGVAPLAAVQAARRYLLTALRVSAPLTIGAGVQRPFNHGYMVSDLQAHPGTPPVGHRPALDLRMYAVTDADCNRRAGRSLVEAVREAVRGGATIVQLREKDASGADFFKAATEALQICRAASVPLLINDRLDIALAVGADGVHLGQSDVPPAVARRLLGPHRLLGVSVKTPEQARQAHEDGADYVGTGAVYPTKTKDGAPVIGFEGVRAVVVAAGRLSMPVVAIGGLSTAARVAEVLAQSGCAGVAVVSAIFAAPDVAAAAAELRATVDRTLALRAAPSPSAF